MPKKKSSAGVTQAAKTLGERGGKKGGPARARALTKKQRQDIAAQGGKAKAAKKKGGA